MSMGPNRRHDNGPFRRQKTILLLTAVLSECAPKAISGANEDRWGEPKPRCYNRPPINGWAPFRSRKRRLPRRITTRLAGHYGVRGGVCASPVSCHRARRWLVWKHGPSEGDSLVPVWGDWTSKEYTWLDLPEVQTRLQSPPDAQVTHPESGIVRDLSDCLAVPLTPAGPVVRLLVGTHPAGDRKPAVGVVRKETVYELFYTTLPPHAFTASDVLQICIVGRLRRFSQTKIRSKTRTVGSLARLAVRTAGRSSRNGCGISV